MPVALLENTTDDGKYQLIAPHRRKILFVGIIQESQVTDVNQELFYIIPDNEVFFGKMILPQDNMGKIKERQQVLIKLKAYPFEEYGMIRGTIKNIVETPNRDGVFMSIADFKIETQIIYQCRLLKGNK
jgi:HlyD family secretion protein